MKAATLKPVKRRKTATSRPIPPLRELKARFLALSSTKQDACLRWLSFYEESSDLERARLRSALRKATAPSRRQRLDRSDERGQKGGRR